VYKWNEDKGTLLKSQRGFGFYDVLLEMQENGVMDHFKHPNSEKTLISTSMSSNWVVTRIMYPMSATERIFF